MKTKLTITIGCLLAGVLLCVAALGVPAPLSAAPDAPALGGTFTVNSNLDTNASNTVLTLREALLLARGGTGASGLGRALSASEQAQLSGCTISGGLITGGCGAGVTNTIVFNMVSTIVTLGSQLPPVDNSAPTNIDGNLVLVRVDIDASALGAGQNGLNIVSSNNTLKNLTVESAPHDNIVITGSHNLLQNLVILSAGLHGVDVLGDYNTIDGNYIGLVDNGNCNSIFSNTGFGVRIDTGAISVTVKNSTVSNNGSIGIAIMSTVSAGDHQIGPNNLIGTSTANNNCGNGLDGVTVSSNSNRVFSNTVAYNAFNGIDVYNDFNNIYGNLVVTNTASGIRLYGNATNNTVGCTRFCGSDIPNVVYGNLVSGIEVTTTTTSFNVIQANDVGASPGYGILIDGATNNTVARNTVHNQAKAGIRISGDAYNNIIGGASATVSNTVQNNGQEGILLTGLETRYNRVDGNLVKGNLVGIRVNIGHDNTIGSTGNNRNTVIQNLTDGIVLDTFAYSNTVGINYVGTDSIGNARDNLRYGLAIVNSYNNVIGPTAWANAFFYSGADGVIVTGTASYGNRISGNEMRYNTGNGLRLDGGAHDNIIGTASNTNYIAMNSMDGVLVWNSHGNTFTYNDIAYNLRNGIEFYGGNAYDNKIDGANGGTIRNNWLNGIKSIGSASGNYWTDVAIFSNSGLGISLNPSAAITRTPSGAFPVITSVSYNGVNTTVQGKATASNGSQNVWVELYAASLNTSGYGEGKTHYDSVLVSNAGTWSITFAGAGTGCYTAFQTIYVPGNFTVDSSEFGPNSCRVMLPIIRR